jgi:hypothetical protein
MLVTYSLCNTERRSLRELLSGWVGKEGRQELYMDFRDTIGRYPRRRPTRRENNITVNTEGKYTNKILVKLLDNSFSLISNVGAADISVLQSIHIESDIHQSTF